MAAHADVYDPSRALALFGMLTANVAHFAENPVPLPPADMTGEDGVVYRWFAAHGFQFHPLANFATLNGHAKNQRREEAGQLAKAMVARGVREGRTLTWEYYFPFAGPGRWTSALAQAAGAQALARTGALLEDDALLAGAGATYREIARDLSQSLGGGTWVKEYSYSDMAVLNAQLQSIVSLAEYARITKDAEAQRYVEQPQHRRPHAPPRVRHGLLVALLARRVAGLRQLPPLPRDPPGAAVGDRGPRDLGGDRRALEGLPQLRLLSRSRNAIAVPRRRSPPSRC